MDEVNCDPKKPSCREDGINCPVCRVFVCARHYWSNKSKNYCPQCATKARFDELPLGPSSEKQSLVKKTLEDFFDDSYSEELISMPWYKKAGLAEEILLSNSL